MLVTPSASDSSRQEMPTLLLPLRTTPSRDPLLVRIRKMMIRDLLRKAERELKTLPVVRRNSHLLKERRIKSALLVKMRKSNVLLRIMSRPSLKEKSVVVLRE